MPALSLAIDFGTTRTKVAYYDAERGEPRLVEIGREIRTIIPSIFYVPPEGQGDRQVGDDAQDFVDSDPIGIVIGLKKELHRPSKIRFGQGRPNVSRIELASDMFSEIRRVCRDEVFHADVTRCTITVPVCFLQQQREAIRQAAELGGFRNITLIEEPVAAAQAWLAGTGDKFGDHVVVCDVGGGTTDLALLRWEGGRFMQVPEVPTAGFEKGGNDVDELIFDQILDLQEEGLDLDLVSQQKSGFLVKLRQLRERLTKDRRESPTITLDSTTLNVQRGIVESVTSKFVGDVAEKTREFLVRSHQVAVFRDCPILLVGGASRLPGLKESLESLALGKVYQWSNSDYATVLGAVEQPTMKTTSAPHSGDSQNLQAYKEAVKAAYADNVLSITEANYLKARQDELGISDQQAKDVEFTILGTAKENLLTNGASPQASSQRGYTSGQIREMVGDGSCERAFEIVSKALARQPDDDVFDLWYRISHIVPDGARVLSVSRDIHRQRQGDLWSACALSVSLADVGRWDEAHATLKPYLIKRYEASFSLRFAQLALLMQDRKSSKFARLLDHLIGISPNHPLLLVEKATFQDEPTKNLALFVKAINADSLSLDAIAGHCLATISSSADPQVILDQGRTSLAAMERIAHEHYLTRMLRAILMFQKSDIRGARAQFDLILLDQRSWEAAEAVHVFRARCNLQLGETAAAYNDLEEALKRDPNLADALFIKGTLLQNDGRYSEAFDCHDRGLKTSPKSVEGLVGRGWAEISLGRHLEAARDFEVAAKMFGYESEHIGLATYGVILDVLSRETEQINQLNGHLFVVPSIPDDKLSAATLKLGTLPEGDSSVLLIYDATSWGTMDEGFFISDRHIVIKNADDRTQTWAIRDIQTVTLCTTQKGIYLNAAKGPNNRRSTRMPMADGMLWNGGQMRAIVCRLVERLADLHHQLAPESGDAS